jgi:hypothetical protein
MHYIFKILYQFLFLTSNIFSEIDIATVVFLYYKNWKEPAEIRRNEKILSGTVTIQIYSYRQLIISTSTDFQIGKAQIYQNFPATALFLPQRASKAADLIEVAGNFLFFSP